MEILDLKPYAIDYIRKLNHKGTGELKEKLKRNGGIFSFKEFEGKEKSYSLAVQTALRSVFNEEIMIKYKM